LQTNAVINDELQGTLVGYLRCGVIFNNQVKKGFVAESASEKGFKVGEHLAYYNRLTASFPGQPG